MAAKILHSLADDNPDLQKQIGCMTGVFQLGRRFPGYSPKRLSLPPGSPQFDNGALESESSNSYQRPYIVEKHTNRVIQDKNRASTESSRDSFSSMSRSSSFSSVDYNLNRTAHPEPDNIVYPETPSRDKQMNRQSVDLRDLVKDSMYRNNKTLVKDDALEHKVNYRESLDALAKFQEANWYYNEEPRELSRSKSYQVRDGSSFSVPNDCPRFSYDGRETNRLSFQSQKITSKEEIPRFSLDSRESSARSLNSGPLSRNPKIDGLTQSRPPSVVAKLMGLETLPDSGSTNKKELSMSPIRTSRVEDVNLLSRVLKAKDHFGPIKMQSSLKSSPREPTSPLWRNSEMKPISKFPIEPAPWKPMSRGMKSPTKNHNSPYSSVYSEVDKRLKHLEFTQSGKDLRALKQILEAMQSMESRKEETESIVRNERFSDRQNFKGSNHLMRAYESPIVIMKPAKLVERSGMKVEDFSNDNTKYFTNSIPKSTRRENTVNITEVKERGRQTRNASALSKEKATTSGKSTGSISPRLQQKKSELDRRSRPPTPPVDSNKPRKTVTKQVSESSSSPGGRRRSKNSNVQQSDDRDRSKKFMTPNRSEDIDFRQSPSSMQEKSSLIPRDDESLDPEYPSPISVLDDTVYMDDSPSPVKHMPKTLKDEAIQEVKDQWATPDDNVIPDTLSNVVTSEINRKKLQNIEHLVQKLTRLNSTHNEAQTDYIASLCENTKPDDRYISEILLASGLLLRDLTTFQFHSSGYPINPELFLVLEQTKFSNKIVRKEKFHRKLIFDTVNEVLEKKLASVVDSLEAFYRKRLVKKTLNAQKLLRDLCVEIEELQVKSKNQEKDIALEDDNDDDEMKSVLWEEVLNRAESWTDYDGEMPVIALEVERLIFKDLVNEVVLSEAADGKRVIKSGRRRRQLFSSK